MNNEISCQSREYNPSYIVSRNPLQYGGKQEDYLIRSRQIIHSIAERISQARNNGENLQALFFVLLEYVSAQRGQLAKDNGTEQEGDFGLRRENRPGMINVLAMGDTYSKYGNKILQYFSTFLKKMELPDGTYIKEMEIKDKFDGKLTTLTFKVQTDQDKIKQGYKKDPLCLLPSHLSEQVAVMRDKKIDFSAEQISKLKHEFLLFKEQSREDYQKYREISAHDTLRIEFPSPGHYNLSPQQVLDEMPIEEGDVILGNMKSLHVQVVLRTQIDNKLYRLTDYLTWMYENKDWVVYRDPAHHPIERMLKKSKIMMLHQDAFLIEDTLKEIAKKFEKIVMWDQKSQTLQDLKDSMAYCCYLLTHNIRDVRGTSAENEWLERGIYESLGIDCIQNQEDQMVDLEAFANPLFSEFIKVYNQMTELKFIL